MNLNENKNQKSIVSFFDGLSCTNQILQNLGVNYYNYYASEIDKSAIYVTQSRFPKTIQLGDINDVIKSDLPMNPWLLTMGSPCTDLSVVNPKSRLEGYGLDGPESSLLLNAVNLMVQIKPRWWLLENTASLASSEKKKITDLMGVEPILINSADVNGCCQNRSRYYWTNIPINLNNLSTDSRTVLQDIIEDGFVDKTKANCVLSKNIAYTKSGLLRYLTKSIGQVVFHDKLFAELPKKEKIAFVENMNDEQARALFRLMTLTELEELQNLNKGYCSDLLPKTNCHKTIGKAFNINTVEFIIAQIPDLHE